MYNDNHIDNTDNNNDAKAMTVVLWTFMCLM